MTMKRVLCLLTFSESSRFGIYFKLKIVLAVEKELLTLELWPT
jgi:hypothetical protein